jgi:hypothetical protein
MPNESKTLSSARRSASAYRTFVDRDLTTLLGSVGAMKKDNSQLTDLIVAEEAIQAFQRSLEKFFDAVTILHEIMDLDPQELDKEPYYVDYCKINDKASPACCAVGIYRANLEESRKLAKEEADHAAFRQVQVQTMQEAQTNFAQFNNTPNNTANIPNSKFLTTLKPDNLEADVTLADYKLWRL